MMKLEDWKPELQHCPDCGALLTPASAIIHPDAREDPEFKDARYCKPCDVIIVPGPRGFHSASN